MNTKTPSGSDPRRPTGFFPRKTGGTPDKKGSPRKEPPRTILVWIVILSAVFLGLQMANRFQVPQATKITYSQFKRLIHENADKIIKLTVVQQGVGRAAGIGTLSQEGPLAGMGTTTTPGSGTHFAVNLPFVDSDMLREWDELGFRYEFQPKDMTAWDWVISFAPWLIFILIWVFMIRQMQSGQRGIFAFGKSRARVNSIDRPQNSFADVAGVEEAKQELQEVIEFLKDPARFKKLGGKIPKGVLLLGPPGTGKTLLARCVAGEAGVPFMSMSGSDFVEMFVGVGASRVRDLFDNAKKNSPCIIFIDEIDAVGRQRGAGLGGGHDEREQTLNQMLVEMDGFEVNSGVILIAATNRPDVLDPALLRPGRFDRQVVVDIPDIKGREAILKIHTRKVPLAEDVNLETLARATPGFVGADLENLVNEAALMAARFSQEKVTMIDFEEARDKVMMGAERKSRVLSEKEKKITAYHEAGHTICNLHCEHVDSLHKVTIIPRGRALGVTWSLPREEQYTLSKEKILDDVCVMMGGRAAEEIVFKRRTSGASNDIQQATRMIRRMICDFGMTDELGPLQYGQKQEQIFLGREFNQHRDYSEKTAEAIDELMRKNIDAQYERAVRILSDHSDELEYLAQALVEHELLDAEEVMRIIKGEKLESAKKTRTPPALEVAIAKRAAAAAAAAGAEAGQNTTDPQAPATEADKPVDLPAGSDESVKP